MPPTVSHFFVQYSRAQADVSPIWIIGHLLNALIRQQMIEVKEAVNVEFHTVHVTVEAELLCQKRPNGSKAPHEGSEKTTRHTFLDKFDVFSTVLSFSFVLASIWLLFGGYWLLLAPLVSYRLSHCLPLAPIVSYCLLTVPIGS